MAARARSPTSLQSVVDKPVASCGFLLVRLASFADAPRTQPQMKTAPSQRFAMMPL
ncbi:hypothetical protein APY04_0537 [Hyphomicrobium sulfonivorans]|uniref:Uncharacterized protein n=1 Tax=Hyphomicrobium sulfonivorans TaxID=121290 RepID=A0A109BM15_HYPSL|nr:hypothetical protein APY04_0537 [Hyphomicrobium sulfonivorans]